MSQELHPTIFKPWNITERAIFFATAISPVYKINNMVRKPI